MKAFKVIIVTVILSVAAEDIITSDENEMDLIIEMLLNNEIHEYTNSAENAIEDENAAEPVFANGVWKCGKCEDIDESRLIYTETYDMDANDEDSINVQVGLSLQKISCVIVTSSVVSELSSVKRVSGNCAGEGATLRITGAAQYDVKVYE